MDKITGKFKKIIFDGNNGYKVILFRVKETSDNLSELVNKTITINGYFHETNIDESYLFYLKTKGIKEEYAKKLIIDSYKYGLVKKYDIKINNENE